MANRISRRNFVKMGVLGAGVLALSGVNASAAAGEKEVKLTKNTIS